MNIVAQLLFQLAKAAPGVLLQPSLSQPGGQALVFPGVQSQLRQQYALESIQGLLVEEIADAIQVLPEVFAVSLLQFRYRPRDDLAGQPTRQEADQPALGLVFQVCQPALQELIFLGLIEEVIAPSQVGLHILPQAIGKLGRALRADLGEEASPQVPADYLEVVRLQRGGFRSLEPLQSGAVEEVVPLFQFRENAGSHLLRQVVHGVLGKQRLDAGPDGCQDSLAQLRFETLDFLDLQAFLFGGIDEVAVVSQVLPDLLAEIVGQVREPHFSEFSQALSAQVIGDTLSYTGVRLGKAQLGELLPFLLLGKQILQI